MRTNLIETTKTDSIKSQKLILYRRDYNQYNVVILVLPEEQWTAIKQHQRANSALVTCKGH